MKTPLRLGILGGGQLARMLAQAAQPLGFQVSVLTEKASDPAAQVTSQVTLGSLDDVSKLNAFLSQVDAVTFESEFVDIEKLKTFIPAKVRVFPNLDSISTIQDRLTQKQLLDRHKIPTAPWIAVGDRAELTQAFDRFPNGFVLKRRRFGYDGYGTFVFRGKEGPSVNFDSYGFIAEGFIEFKRELAILIAKSNKQTRVFPLVESVQKDSRCFSVKGPIRNSKIKALERKMIKLMSDLNYEGVLAFELFENKKGELLVNELAPRVHNSAHYSLNGLTHSQFEYHLRAGLGLPLPQVECVQKGFAMVNLLGGDQKDPILSFSDLGFLHWYGKLENRRGRKMGHLNTLGSTPDQALKKALKMRKEIKL